MTEQLNDPEGEAFHLYTREEVADVIKLWYNKRPHELAVMTQKGLKIEDLTVDTDQLSVFNTVINRYRTLSAAQIYRHIKSLYNDSNNPYDMYIRNFFGNAFAPIFDSKDKFEISRDESIYQEIEQYIQMLIGSAND